MFISNLDPKSFQKFNYEEISELIIRLQSLNSKYQMETDEVISQRSLD